MFGRAFELADGTLILPCEFCGCPAFEPDRHMCAGLYEAMCEEAKRRTLEDL